MNSKFSCATFTFRPSIDDYRKKVNQFEHMSDKPYNPMKREKALTAPYSHCHPALGVQGQLPPVHWSIFSICMISSFQDDVSLTCKLCLALQLVFSQVKQSTCSSCFQNEGFLLQTGCIYEKNHILSSSHSKSVQRIPVGVCVPDQKMQIFSPRTFCGGCLPGYDCQKLKCGQVYVQWVCPSQGSLKR